MQTIPIAFYLVMIELAIGSFVMLVALDARGGTTVNFLRTQTAIYLLLFTLIAWATLQAFDTARHLRADGYHLDFTWLARQEPAVLWFMLLQIAYLVLLVVSKDWRVGRLVVGGLACALGIFALVAIGMGLRPIADVTLGGAFTAAGFLTGALALGGVSTSMLLGHWYLNTPTASGKPLEFATMLTIAGMALQIGFLVLSGPSHYVAAPAHATAQAATVTVAIAAPKALATQATPTAQATGGQSAPASPVPHGVRFNTITLVVIGVLLGLASLAVSGIALYLERERSFQSATGMLYIAVVLAFFAEILGRALFLRPLI